MAKPGENSTARLHVELHDTIWETLYLPVIRVVDMMADRLNRLQFLTIRTYLTIVFAALILLLIIVGTWR